MLVRHDEQHAARPSTKTWSDKHHPAVRGTSRGPIFIVGHWRSGTTLLSVMLDRHSAIAVTPETHFVEQMAPRFSPSWPNAEERPETGPLDFIARMLNDTRLADLRLEPARVLECLGERPLTPESVFDSILRCYAISHNKPLVAEKTPGHLHYLDLLLRWFPEARFVWVVRDGRDAVRSMRRLPWVSLPLWDLCLRWRRNMKELRRFERLYPQRIHRVRFESLLEHPDREIARLCAFLGVRFEPLHAQAPSRPTPSSVVPHWELDWKGRATTPIDRSRLAAWREEADEREVRLMECLMGQQLDALGYRRTTAASPPASAVQKLADAALELLLSRPVYPVVRGTYALLLGIGKGGHGV